MPPQEAQSCKGKLKIFFINSIQISMLLFFSGYHFLPPKTAECSLLRDTPYLVPFLYWPNLLTSWTKNTSFVVRIVKYHDLFMIQVLLFIYFFKFSYNVMLTNLLSHDFELVYLGHKADLNPSSMAMWPHGSRTPSMICSSLVFYWVSSSPCLPTPPAAMNMRC